MEKAKRVTAMRRMKGNQEMTDLKAAEVSCTPSRPPVSSAKPVKMSTSEVMVQMTMVSMKGSMEATMPSLTGSSFCAAAWAMADDPMPASLEKAPRWMP